MALRALRDIRDGLLSLCYPQVCHVCGGAVEAWDDGVVCAECWDDPALTRVLTPCVCAKCGSPLAPSTGPAAAFTTAGCFCGLCSSAPFDLARACGVYSGAFEASVLSLKITPHICPRLRKIIHRTFTEHQKGLIGDVVIPVPLHRLRERQRGFNQAAIIARLVCREFGLRLDTRALKRIKHTERHRAGMDANDRAQSVERAFEVGKPGMVAGASVLLVDDVYTTGSTICAASQALLDAGAQRVTVLTVARVGDR